MAGATKQVVNNLVGLFGKYLKNLRKQSPIITIRSRSTTGKNLICSYSLNGKNVDKRNFVTSTARTERRLGIINSNFEIHSHYADVDIPKISVMDFCFHKMKENSDSVAIVDVETRNEYTWGKVMDSVRRVASGLTRLGYKKGDTICIFSTNCPEFTIMMMAVTSLGAVVTPANHQYNIDELKKQLEDSRTKAICVSPSLINTAQEAAKGNPRIKDIICLGDAIGNCVQLSDLLEDDGGAFPDDVTIDPFTDVAFIPYSSGTTGLPKGVMLSHYNIVSNIHQCGAVLPSFTGGRSLAILPFFHIYGLVVIQFSAVDSNYTLYTMPSFEPKKYLQAVQDEKISLLNVVPPIVILLAKHPDVLKYDLSHLKHIVSGAAPLGKDITQQLQERFPNVEIFQGYGLTETSPVTHIDPPPSHFGTIGSVLPNTKVKVVDIESGSNVGPGEVGEMCVKGPQVMMGYLNNRKATEETIQDGWLHTGDVATYDEDGIFTITDRIKELIKYKGFQVAPAEIENLLLTHPDVQDAGVVGLPDYEAGELPCAFVSLKAGKITKETDILSFINNLVAPYKKLRGGVIIVKEIPKSASGKILRRKLKEDYLN